MAKYSRKKLISEISKDTNIREAVVKMVLDRFMDISIEKIANSEEYNIMNICSFEESYHENIKINGNELNNYEEKIINQWRLNPRLSNNLKELYKIQKEEYPDNPYVVNRDNWKEIVAWRDKEKRNKDSQ